MVVVSVNNSALSTRGILSLTRFEEINGEHYIDLTTPHELNRGDIVLVTSDVDGKTREYVVWSIEEPHEQDLIARQYRCVWSLQAFLYGVPCNAMPGTGGTPATARAALEGVLEYSHSFEVGTVEPTTTGSASFWRMTAWNALTELVKNWGGEVDMEYTQYSRTVSLLNRIGLDEAFSFIYGSSDVMKITRKWPDGINVCRVTPLGAAKQTDNGGYGRKTDITSVNGGLPYIEDTEKAAEYADDPEPYPTAYIENSDITDPAELKAWAESVLYSITRPEPDYTVELTERYVPLGGYIPKLGDSGKVVDNELGAVIETRVTAIQVDELAVSVNATLGAVSTMGALARLVTASAAEFSYLAELPLASTAAKYSGTDYPVYSRDGRTVILWGAVKPTATVAAGGELAVGTLPEGYRPKVGVLNICQGSGTQIFATRVRPDGRVTVERYRNETGYVQMTTSAWLPLYVSFQI